MRKKIKAVMLHPAPDEIVGHFGRTQLVKMAGGKHVLIGGTEKEQSMVRSWCKHFAPFIAFTKTQFKPA